MHATVFATMASSGISGIREYKIDGLHTLHLCSVQDLQGTVQTFLGVSGCSRETEIPITALYRLLRGEKAAELTLSTLYQASAKLGNNGGTELRLTDLIGPVSSRGFESSFSSTLNYNHLTNKIRKCRTFKIPRDTIIDTLQPSPSWISQGLHSRSRPWLACAM